MLKMLFDDEYKGPRWRYGLKFRPLGYAQVPDGWIIHSNRPDKQFAHGTVDYPRKLSGTEVEGFQLTLLAHEGGTDG